MRTYTGARSRARTCLVAVALALIAAVGGCGSGGPGTYLIDMLQTADDGHAANLLPRPDR